MKLCVSWMLFLCAIFCSKSGTASLIRQKANHTIVALLPVHTSERDSKRCSNHINFKAAVQTQALIYAVRKLNSNSTFQGEISLGFDIEDICTEKPENLLNVMNTLFKRHKNQNPTAFLVDLPDLLRQLVAHKSQNVPVFSLGSRSGASQSDNALYLESNTPRLGKALSKLLQELNWKIFDVLVANTSDYDYFTEAAKSSKVCQNRVFYKEYISAQSYHTGNELYPILLLSDSLETLTTLSSKFRGRNVIIASDFLDIDQRFAYPKSLAVKQRVENLDEFETFLLDSVKRNDSWFRELIRNSAQFQNCYVPGTGSCWPEMLEMLSKEVRHGGKVIDAVYTIAHALKNTRKRSLTNEDIILTPEFTSLTGRQICFTAKKHLSKIEYSVYDLAKKPPVLIGNVETSETSTTAELNLDGLEMNRNTNSCLAACPDGFSPVPSPGKFAKCCVTCHRENATECAEGLRLNEDVMECIKVRVDYLRWKNPVSIVIFIVVILLFCLLLYLVNLYHKKAQTSAILTSKLATLPLLFSLFITLVHPLLPIIKPSTTSCNAYVFGFIQALGIPLCILTSRSNSYFKRFRGEDGSLKKKICRADPQNLIAIFLILFQITLSIIFITVSSAHVVYYKTTDPSIDYIECSTFTGSEFLFPFFYTIILSLFFTVKNFGAVTQEEDSYESHFTAIFFFGFYFLSFVNIVVVYGVVGKVKVMLLCFLGVLHVLNFLGFLFFPKVYVIVLKKEPTRFRPQPLNSDTEMLVLDLSDQTIQVEHKGGSS